MQIRVGLNSGEVVVRAIGSDLHMDYSAVGQTTYLAAQMERLARPGSTLLTPETRRLAEGFLAVTPLGPVPIKRRRRAGRGVRADRGGPGALPPAGRGGARPVALRRPRGRGRAAARGVRAELRGRGPDGGAGGEPGVGKSRVIREFVEGAVDGRRDPAGGPAGRLPEDAVAGCRCRRCSRRYRQVDLRDDAQVIREKITGKLLALDRALEPPLPALLSLADLEPEDDGVARARSAAAPPAHPGRGAQLAAAESRRQPLVLVVEDLQRIDEETQALLDNLVDRLRARAC